MIRQSPSAGSRAAAAARRVSIVVSKGEEKATVPNVIGKQRAEAVEALRAAGLDAGGAGRGNRSALARSAASPTSSRRPAPKSNRAATVTLVVGKAAAGGAEPEAEEAE